MDATTGYEQPRGEVGAAGQHLQDSQPPSTVPSNPLGHQDDTSGPDNFRGQCARRPLASHCDDFVENASQNDGPGLRDEGETRISQILAALREEFSASREEEKKRIVGLEKAINNLRPPPRTIDPVTNFWTAYKMVSDECDNYMASVYVQELDNSLLFTGLFSAITTAFIVQIIPSLQPNPSDLTNALLLRLLQQNTSFGGTDPPTPITNTPASAVRAHSILVASLSVTLLVAFIAMLGKQWIAHYMRVSPQESIVDQGKERQIKFVGLQKWGFYFIVRLLPILLQLALLLFAIALVIYLWDLDTSAALIVLATAGIGCTFHASIAIVATVWNDCPFQTSLSILVSTFRPQMKEFDAQIRGWLRRGFRWWACSISPQIERALGNHRLTSPIGRLCKVFFGEEIIPDRIIEDVYDKHYSMILLNPAFWRRDPLFPPIPKDTDITVSAGIWLLENSFDSSAATSVAAAFPEFQWSSHHYSITTLIRLGDAYLEHIREARFDKSARRKALQCAATYYVLFHTWLIWSASRCQDAEIKKLPPSLLPDLFLYEHNNEWGGDDIFEHLLHIKLEDRSEPITSARFLSYIAPYWFCGDSDAGVRFRPTKLPILRELIITLERSKALDARTLTDCFLCAGAAMDLPLHPEDLIRVDKSEYIVPTFRTVVNHIHRIAVAQSRRHRYVVEALDILLALLRHTNLPLVDSVWINELLKHAAEVDMADKTFIMFLKLSARRMEEVTAVDMEEEEGFIVVQSRKTDPRLLRRMMVSDTPSPDDTLFDKIMKNIRNCVGDGNGWRDDAVYGGLVAIAGIRHLEASHFRDDVLQALCEAMHSDRPLRVREAAYDAMLVTRDQWIKSEKLRQKLEDVGFSRLHSTVVDIGRSDYQQSFLMITEVLSEDEYWHSYLRETMEIWLSLRQQGPEHAVRILANVGGMLHAWWNPFNTPPLDEHLPKLVEDEWAGVPARPVHSLSVDRLQPLVEVTEQFGELLLDNNYRRVVLARVEGVIPGLEQRRDDGYGGPGEDVRGIVNALVERLRTPSRHPPRLLAQ